MSSAALEHSWLETGPLRSVAGHLYGRRQPSVFASLRAATQRTTAPDVFVPREALEALLQTWEDVTGTSVALGEPSAPEVDWRTGVHCLGACAVALMRSAGLPAFESPVLLHLPEQDRRAFDWSILLLPVPAHQPAATRDAWLSTLHHFEQWRRAGCSGLSRADLQHAIESLKPFAPAGTNTSRFLRSAYELGVPVTPLGMEVFQYGQGRRAQWLDSTLTLKTPATAVRFARDKRAAAARLRQAGLPVPDHQMAPDAEAAVRVASRLGYPVVVKPADLDGGRGVAPGLETEDEVRAAFEQASALSARVLVEKHFFGRNYRLAILDGQVLWANERVPASVTGDGTHTVEQLLERENADPDRGNGPPATLRRIHLDDEARLLLQKQGLSPEAVPALGRFVVLRRIPNLSVGGRPVPVNERLHPDNARLAVRAAEALRLDLAGIDLLIPDIARSWRKVGAVICEVNGRPQLSPSGMHQYTEILAKRLGGNGRIPVVVVIGAPPDSPLSEVVARCLMAQGHCVGWSDTRGACVDEDRLTNDDVGTFAAGQMLLTHPQVDALVLDVHDDALLRQGLPVDRIDWLVVAGTHLSFGDRRQAPPDADRALRFGQLLACVLPACSGEVVHLQVSGTGLQGLDEAALPGLDAESMSREDLLARLAERFGPPFHPPSPRTPG